MAGRSERMGRRRVVLQIVALLGLTALGSCKHLAGGRPGCVEPYGYGCDRGDDRDDAGGGSPGGGGAGGGGGGAGGGAGGGGGDTTGGL